MGERVRPYRISRSAQVLKSPLRPSLIKSKYLLTRLRQGCQAGHGRARQPLGMHFRACTVPDLAL